MDNTVFSLIDRYKELLDRKEALADQTKENNKLIEEIREQLAQRMMEEEVTKVSRGGFSYSLSEKTKYSKKADMEEELFEALRMNGLGDIIVPTVAPQTLQAAMKNLAEENGDELPEEFAEILNVYSYLDVSKRKETARK